MNVLSVLTCLDGYNWLLLLMMQQILLLLESGQTYIKVLTMPISVSIIFRTYLKQVAV